MNFKIDPEFRDYLPPQTKDEFQRLSVKIEEEGCAQCLVVANIAGERILIDGHNSLKICQDKGLKYPSPREIKFPNRDLVKEWMIDNQLARRNLTDERRAYYIGKKYLEQKQQKGGEREAKGNDCPLVNHPSAKALAENVGVNEKTVRNNAKFAEAVDELPPDEQAAVLNGTSGKSMKEVVQASRPIPTTTKRKPPKPGKVTFDWKAFNSTFGALLREVDRFGNAYACKESQVANELREDLDRWRKKFKTWAEFKSKEKVPDA